MTESKQEEKYTEEMLELRKRNEQLQIEVDLLKQVVFEANNFDCELQVNLIKNNLHRYSVSKMCEVLQLPRSTYYEVNKRLFNQNS